MAKVMIYEDNFVDLTDRYASLSDHDVIVFMKDSSLYESFENEDHANQYFKRKGFSFSEMKWEAEDGKDWFENPPEAEVYFTDGLKNEALSLLERLPRDRAYLASGDEELRDRASLKGYSQFPPDENVDLEELIKLAQDS